MEKFNGINGNVDLINTIEQALIDLKEIEELLNNSINCIKYKEEKKWERYRKHQEKRNKKALEDYTKNLKNFVEYYNKK